MLNELLMKNLLGRQDPNFEGICGKCGESIMSNAEMPKSIVFVKHLIDFCKNIAIVI
jgi:hypothetical protein